MELDLRIQPMHRDMFRRMLGLNELPDFLLEHYFAVKKLLDKIDGFMSPMDLLRIAIDCGFDIDTRRFNNILQSTEPPTKTAEVSPKIEEKDTPEVKLTPKPTKVIKKVNKPQPVEKPKPEPILEPEIQPEPEPENTTPVVPNGTKVSAFFEGEIINGKVTGNIVVGGSRTYTVDTGDDILEIEEDDIEVS